MKISNTFAIAVTCLVFATACNRNAEPETTTPAATTPDAGMTADAPAPIAAEEPFMMKSFAGTFSADGHSVTLNADGTYMMKMGDASSDGTWTADTAGKQLLLDPNSKSESDQSYSVVSNNEISALDGGMRMQREGTAN